MKTLAALSLAAALTVGSMTGASAITPDLTDMEALATQQVEPSAESTLFDRCHGRASGTSHWSCGTTTGGPAGGLF